MLIIPIYMVSIMLLQIAEFKIIYGFCIMQNLVIEQ